MFCCRLRDFSQTYIHVQVIDESDPSPTPEQFAQSLLTNGAQDHPAEPEGEGKAGNGNKRPPPSPNISTRKSKRLRQSAVKKGKTIRISVERGDTVLSLKRKIADKIDTVVALQKLFHHGLELVDNAATLHDVGIVAHDNLVVQPAIAKDEELDIVSDGAAYKAFSGTALGGGGATKASQAALVSSLPMPLEQPIVIPMEVDMIAPSIDASFSVACPACTFVNEPLAEKCEICQTAF